MSGKCPRCGYRTVKQQTSDELGETFTWCTHCHWEPDGYEEEHDDEDEMEDDKNVIDR